MPQSDYSHPALQAIYKKGQSKSHGICYTAYDRAASLGVPLSTVVKSVWLIHKDLILTVLTTADARVDVQKIKEVFPGSWRIADERVVQKMLGLSPSRPLPFCAPEKVALIFDTSLYSEKKVWIPSLYDVSESILIPVLSLKKLASHEGKFSKKIALSETWLITKRNRKIKKISSLKKRKSNKKTVKKKKNLKDIYTTIKKSKIKKVTPIYKGARKTST
jgi:prolyl-tRNA editing enzyme YbaK/EbsC (Cys-tRNA(Pro) deacylase)